MRCREANNLIQTEEDGTLSARDHARLREHLAGCAGCRQVRAGHHTLMASLAADPERKVSDGFETCLQARLASAPMRSPLIAWWRRLAFLASWRLAPALAASAALAVVAVGWIAAPRPAENSPHLAEYVQQHRALVRMIRQPVSSPEQEVVEFSIAQSTQRSISDTD